METQPPHGTARSDAGDGKGGRLMVKLHSYIVRVDSGFAPNPFYGLCTVTTCKPDIRRVASVGDWVIGSGSKSKGRDGCLVFAMRVSEAMSFAEYWKDPRFRRKRPDMNSSKKRACGDNIYHVDRDTGQFVQVPLYHSCSDGTPDFDKLAHDTKVDRVLISDDFVYWGGDGPPVPEFRGVRVCHTTQKHKSNFPDEVVREFIAWIRGFTERGCRGRPLDF